MLTMNEQCAKLEALLFYYGEPVTVKKACDLLGISEGDAEGIVTSLATSLQENESRGLFLMRQGDKIQLVTKPAVQDVGKKIIQEEFRETLTPAALETLSLIAYLGPLSRATIDYIRGVNSSFTVRSLLVRGLVERHAGCERANAYEYAVTFDCLQHLGLQSASELPDYEKYHAVLQNLESNEKTTTEGGIQPETSDTLKTSESEILKNEAVVTEATEDFVSPQEENQNS